MPAPNDPTDEFGALQEVIQALRPLAPEIQKRIITATTTFLGIDPPVSAGANRNHPETAPSSPTEPRYPPFSSDRSMSPKEFMIEKQPRTDVERIAALAYYLTHYRGTPHFKTLDLSKLNTEAALPKFSNAASSVNNALKTGYLVQATKGQKQLSAAGEQFINALPDREAARLAMASARPRRTIKRAAAVKRPARAPQPQDLTA